MSCHGSLSESVYGSLWDLYNSTNGIHWTWSTQLPSSTIWTFPSNLSTPCSNSWQGLACSVESPNSCSVEEIILNSYNLNGYLPSSLGEITSVKRLELAENSLIGTIPSQLGNLQSMEKLFLNTNSLSGTMSSELGNLLSLEQLHLYLTFLTGTIPSELGNLQSLQELYLYFNSLTGTIPSELGNLQSLEELYLGVNFLNGTIPSELGNLQYLEELYLGDNGLTGIIPSELGEYQSLHGLFLDVNSLTGIIPSELGNLRSLQGLYLGINSLTGTIPSELGNLHSLLALFLDVNCLSGNIPSELGNHQSLVELYLDFNSLTGTIPNELGNLQLMLQLYLGINSLSGTIPSELGSLQSLEELSLDSNSLSGTIPSELGDIHILVHLYLNSNSLSGTIPSELGSHQFLIVLSLYFNGLSGSIPCELGNLQSLQYLLVYNNYLTGLIPREYRNLSSMEIMLLDSNLLTGVLANDVVGGMLRLSTLGLSENSLSRSLPNELGQLNKILSRLFLNSNLFTGTIPLHLFNCSSLEIVDLSFNRFSGAIVGFAGLPRLTQFNAAGNALGGLMPEATFGALLKSIDMSSNYLEGTLGFQFFNCSQLESIELGDNSLKGTIPGYLYDLPSLLLLNVSRNELSGDLSAWGYTSQSLKTIDFSSNELSGTLPSQLLGMPSLVSLNASSNGFFGSLSGFNLTNSSLKSLDVSSNHLTGVLPQQLFEMKSLQDVLLFSNCFSGSLPETLCSSSSLEYLVLNELTSNCGSAIPRLLRPILQGEVARQLMKGSIPDCIWGMSSLKALQLSGNGLKGSIGQSVDGGLLKSLLLSGNQLTGTIPAWIQQSSTLQQLDLSQNRLSGSLSSSLVISSTSSLFRASTNRLSGYLPEALFLTTSNLILDVLNGNDFACSSVSGIACWGSVLTPEDLPKSDKTHATNICGSSLFDSYLLLTAFLIVVLGLSSFAMRCNCRGFQYLNEFNDLKGFSVFTLISTALMVLFVCLHSIPSLSEFSTHSEQYLWVTTAAYLRGWAPVMVILLAISAGEIAVTVMYCRSLHRGNIIITGSSKILHASIALSFVTVHLLNIVAVVTTNSAYVYATVNGLPRGQLFVIQFFLGCFKLAWNGSAIPLFLRFSKKEINTTNNRVFMSLFSFIGGPFISTFFSASSCFLYVISQQATLTSVVTVPQYTCSSNCKLFCNYINCYYECPLECGLQEVSVWTTSTPVWNYSYQCSSTLLLSYIPVMIATMTVSGLILPCLVLVQFVIKDSSLTSYLIRIVPRSLMTGERFDVVRLGRFLRVKSLVNVTTMLTFGFASPLLGVLIVLDTVSWQWMWQVLVNRQREYLSLRVNTGSSDLFRFSELLHVALRKRSPTSSDCLIVLSFVGVFWSLFVFDMIGDVYGDLSGGLSMLVTVILGAVIWLLIVRFRGVVYGNQTIITHSITSPGIELSDDNFVLNSMQKQEETEAVMKLMLRDLIANNEKTTHLVFQ